MSMKSMIKLCVKLTITENENTLFLEKGQSILIKPNTAYTIQTNSEVEIYKARVPK
jgi:mannose-6-phosphate isomerase